MIDPRDFIEVISGFANDTKKDQSPNRPPRLATVDAAYASGKPRVTFDGDTTLSPDGFAFLVPYTPVAGDRVVMLPVGNTYVILGASVSETSEETTTRPFGHAGRTGGFQSVSATNGAFVTLASQELTHGMTFTDNGLVVPQDGLYEIVAKGYFTGGTAYAGQWGATINVNSVPAGDMAAGHGVLWKADGNDFTGWSVVRRRLEAGDTVRLWHQGPNSTWGTTGYNGAYLEVLFIEP